MNHYTRTFFFEYCSWIVTLLSVVGCYAIYEYVPKENSPQALTTLAGAALGIIFLVQKQRNEELQIFQQLFMKFNERYGGMHAALQSIVCETTNNIPNMRETLDSYFNLCAEEYLFFREGKILPIVWNAWCRGMVEYLKVRSVRIYWEGEQSIDSHYGLTSTIIFHSCGMIVPPIPVD